jgi:uncharacterized repeat protein (TIGR03803 family)
VADSSGIRYGTAANGGSVGYGTVFAVNPDGTGFTNLHSFNNSDGANPWTGLVLLGHTLYGTTYRGGSSGDGTLFAVNTDGTGFTTLHTFTGGSDGGYPNGGLIISGNALYGTTAHGGMLAPVSTGDGTVFAINTDGTGFTTLHTFPPALGQSVPGYDLFRGEEYYVWMYLNTDGAVPVAGLILAGNTLYGTASGGGNGGNGTVFRVNTDGTGFAILHHFEQTENLTRQYLGGGILPPGGVLGPPGWGCTGDSSCGAGMQCIGGACACRGFCGGGG